MKIVIIPARLESKRLNRKLLLPGPNGKPLLYFTWKQALKSIADETYIATDSVEIIREATKFGANTIMTKSTHNCGTNRIAEAYNKITSTADCIVNLQGDEPEIRVEDINLLIKQFTKWNIDKNRNINNWMKIATLTAPFYDFHQCSLLQNVKVVFGEVDNEAIYFSRNTIPLIDSLYESKTKLGAPIIYKHIGIYAYTPKMLQHFVHTKASRLEKIENLEQMRAIENRWPILVIPIKMPENANHDWPLGINTNHDYKIWYKRMETK